MEVGLGDERGGGVPVPCFDGILSMCVTVTGIDCKPGTLPSITGLRNIAFFENGILIRMISDTNILIAVVDRIPRYRTPSSDS